MTEAIRARWDDIAPGAPASLLAADLGPAGQTVLPWAPAQLGLDGRAYDVVPAPPAPPETPPGSNPPLGPPHALSTTARQLTLPKLTVGRRLRAVRGILSRTVYDRQAKCRWVSLGGGGRELERNENGGYKPHGYVLCGHMSCPACGPQRARSASAAIGACMDAWMYQLEHDVSTDDEELISDDGDDTRGPRYKRKPRAKVKQEGHDVWMLSPTIPHYEESLWQTTENLYAAWSLFQRAPEWRRFRARWGVRAVARFLDATFETGGHPHFHIALFVDGSRFVPVEVFSAFPQVHRSGTKRRLADARLETEAQLERHLALELGDDAPRTASDFAAKNRAVILRQVISGLVPVWRRCCEQVGAAPRDAAAFASHALELTGADRARRYFTKWAFEDELTGAPLKSDNHLALLDRAGAGDDAAGQLFLDFRGAIDGRQWVTGLADTLEACGVDDDDVSAYAELMRDRRERELAAAGTPLKKVQPFRVRIPDELAYLVHVLDWDPIQETLDAAVDQLGLDPQETLERFLEHAARRSRSLGQARASPDELVGDFVLQPRNTC